MERTNPLLLTPREAARTVAVCERSLWSMTAPRGPIPCVRIGRSVRYALDDLRQFIEHQKRQEGGAEGRHR